MDYVSGRKTHNLLLPVRIKLMETLVRIRLMERLYLQPSPVNSRAMSSPVEHPQMKDFLITILMTRLWWLNVGKQRHLESHSSSA